MSKKTVNITRSNNPHYTDDWHMGSGHFAPILCQEELNELLSIPKEVTKAWLTISTKKPSGNKYYMLRQSRHTGSVKYKLPEGKSYKETDCYFNLSNLIGDVKDAAGLDIFDPVNPVYAWIEYYS